MPCIPTAREVGAECCDTHALDASPIKHQAANRSGWSTIEQQNLHPHSVTGGQHQSPCQRVTHQGFRAPEPRTEPHRPVVPPLIALQYRILASCGEGSDIHDVCTAVICLLHRVLCSATSIASRPAGNAVLKPAAWDTVTIARAKEGWLRLWTEVRCGMDGGGLLGSNSPVDGVETQRRACA